jgi:hypothetical protein
MDGCSGTAILPVCFSFIATHGRDAHATTGRGATDAIRLHVPTLIEPRKKFCFPETKKDDFLIFFEECFNHGWTQTKEKN